MEYKYVIQIGAKFNAKKKATTKNVSKLAKVNVRFTLNLYILNEIKRNIFDSDTTNVRETQTNKLFDNKM